MFTKETFKSKVPLAGESAESCRRRVWDECKKQWREQGPTGECLRRTYSLKAAEVNKAQRETAAEEALTNQNTTEFGVVATSGDSISWVDHLQAIPGLGVLGLGDDQYGLSVDIVAQVDESTPGFVNSYSEQWRTRCVAQIKATSVAPGTTRLSCYQDIGFCKLRIGQTAKVFNSVVQHLREFAAAHRQSHLVKGKNKGPDSKIYHPLLFAWSTTFSLHIDSDQSFFVVGYILC